ncbi:MAG: Ig-like domain-containing protein [Verrucomicrobia bacterium]|nr:Ig-like domain-containing protein [Verrucomicrobiota bacterium]
MIQIKRILLAAVSALLSLPLAAQVPFTGSYSQNFDAMGTGTAPPTGWSHIGTLGGSNSSWATIIPASGSLSAASAGTPNNTLIASTSFTSSIKSDSQAYNFALGTSTADRSLGTSPTSGAGNILQLRLTNNTVAAVSAIRIGYDIRRFTAPGANQLPGYWLFYSIDGGTTWTNVSALNPAASGATVNVPNSTGVTSVPLTTVTFPSSVAISSEIRLRWVDDNAQETSPDQIIGLDNVSIQLPVVNALPTATLTAPAAGATFDAPATVNLTATATDTDGTISKVEFFNGATKLGEDTTDPYEFSWNNVVTGSYALTAVATDNLAGTATSSAVNITVTNADNVAPSVTLTAPANGATILTDSITLTATAADTDGTVTKVEFFNGATKLGEDTTSPYAFNWTGVATGNYSLTAKATDNDGGTTTSSAANISVAVPITSTLIAKGATWKFRDNGTDQGTAWKETGFDDSAWPAGPAPLGYGDSHIVTTVYSPAAPNRYITTYFRRTFNVSGAAAIQALNMNILRDDGVIVYINGTEVARQNMPAGAFDYLTWSSDIVSGADETTYFPSSAAPMPILVDGDNTIAVELHQRDGTSSDLGLDMELISVALPGTPPTVALTAPADGASFTAPATIAITADAADTDGTVTKVEFFEGANKLGEDTVAPYTSEWTIVPQGTYTLTAKATDNFGQSTTSDAVNITVAPPNTLPPTVAITTPANNASFTTPASITISADAADSDGTVSKVEFFNGATKLGEAASEPYTYNWSNVAVGDYTLTAVATDNLTATTTSSAVVIHVLPNQPPTISQTAPADLASVSAPAANLQVALSDPESQALTVTFYGREKTATAGADFTLVTLPDTQFYSSNASYFSNFTSVPTRQ